MSAQCQRRTRNFEKYNVGHQLNVLLAVKWKGCVRIRDTFTDNNA